MLWVDEIKNVSECAYTIGNANFGCYIVTGRFKK